MDGMHLMRKKMDELFKKNTNQLSMAYQCPFLTIHLIINETFKKITSKSLRYKFTLHIKPKCYISMFETHMVFSQSHDEIARFSKLSKVLDSSY
jgi:hypothetical protein